MDCSALCFFHMTVYPGDSIIIYPRNISHFLIALLWVIYGYPVVCAFPGLRLLLLQSIEEY